MHITCDMFLPSWGAGHPGQQKNWWLPQAEPSLLFVQTRPPLSFIVPKSQPACAILDSKGNCWHLSRTWRSSDCGGIKGRGDIARLYIPLAHHIFCSSQRAPLVCSPRAAFWEHKFRGCEGSVEIFKPRYIKRESSNQKYKVGIGYHFLKVSAFYHLS